ncbi:hypothetical protein Tco_0845778 [Tanacetum coccineum]
MASNPENVRLNVLMKLQEALDEEAILEEQILSLMHHFANRFTDRRVEINNLMVLHDHQLIDYELDKDMTAMLTKNVLGDGALVAAVSFMVRQSVIGIKMEENKERRRKQGWSFPEIACKNSIHEFDCSVDRKRSDSVTASCQQKYLEDLTDKFTSEEKGTADEVVDFNHAKQLWELCKEK